MACLPHGRTTHGKIANEAEGLQLSQTIASRAGAAAREDDVILLRSATGKENHLHTPPMLFPHDSLVLLHDPAVLSSSSAAAGAGGGTAAGVQTRVEFSVLDALSCWAVQHQSPALAAFIPEVPFAHKWQQPQQSKAGQQQQQSDEAKSGGNSGSSGEGAALAGVAGDMHCQQWDWTYRYARPLLSSHVVSCLLST